MKYFSSLFMLCLLPFQYGCSAGAMFTVYDKSQSIEPIIVVADNLSKLEQEAFVLLKTTFEASIGKKIKTKTENSISKSNKNPIVYIGTTKANKTINKSLFPLNGFEIIQKDEAIYLHASNEQYLFKCISYFIENYLEGIKPDEGNTIYETKTRIAIPKDLNIHEEPAFEFRQAYFPAANKLAYQQWHACHHFENEWACWGHNLGKLLTRNNNNNVEPAIYALINGVRNNEQFCFNSEVLFKRIEQSIKIELQNDSTNKIWSIAANDNALVCQCNQCKLINNNTNSATESICKLINRLAKRFPNQRFSTLAYSTTIEPPQSIELAKNVIVVLSTIDLPKGMAINEQKNSIEFKQQLKGWKKKCSSLYVWDYPIQYTNYFDVFPNLPALQKDLQYFKKEGIKGVFEHGSETQYSLFTEWKCYAIAKLLWNPNIDLSENRKIFFNKFYGKAGRDLETFYQTCEQNLVDNKKTLDIYGNVSNSAKAFLDYTKLKILIASLQKSLFNTKENDRIQYNVEKLITSLNILSIQYMRWKGINEDGYAEAINDVSWQVKPNFSSTLNKLKKDIQSYELDAMNENGLKLSTYIHDIEHDIASGYTKNLIWNNAITFNIPFDESYPANGNKTLNDGLSGSLDYSSNWLLFNKTNMDVLIPINVLREAKQIKINFLHDPMHYIFLPRKIKIFAGNDKNSMSLMQTLSPLMETSLVANSVSFKIPFNQIMKQAKYLQIVAENSNELPSWKFHSSKKPTIACDEINIQ